MMGPDAFDLGPFLREITGGNPFFVGELLRHLKESGCRRTRARERRGGDDRARIAGRHPRRIGRRLARTTERCQQTLTLAAVVGREFDLGVLKTLGDLTEDHLLDALDEAVAAHLNRGSARRPESIRASFMRSFGRPCTRT